MIPRKCWGKIRVEPELKAKLLELIDDEIERLMRLVEKSQDHYNEIYPDEIIPSINEELDSERFDRQFDRLHSVRDAIEAGREDVEVGWLLEKLKREGS